VPLISSFPGPCQHSRGSLMAEAGSEEAFGKGGLKNARPGDKKREIHVKAPILGQTERTARISS